MTEGLDFEEADEPSKTSVKNSTLHEILLVTKAYWSLLLGISIDRMCLICY